MDRRPASLHLGFLVRPWFKNVSRSLRKEPKWFLRDWASIEDPGDKAETFVGCHLLKAVEGWNDMGLGKFELGYLRDKEKREVDFLVVRDGKPWFLVEVKQSDDKGSKSLDYFQDRPKLPSRFKSSSRWTTSMRIVLLNAAVPSSFPARPSCLSSYRVSRAAGGIVA